jgi:D-cysteine desulfhydrase
MTDYLALAHPALASRLHKMSFAALPTPVSEHHIRIAGGHRSVIVKHDDQSSPVYGGNKIRKLEYLFQRAKERGSRRVATIGSAGSNHALATAIFAKQSGFECTCFLAHQKRTPNIAKTLDAHLSLGTEIVRYGGGIDRLQLFRRHLQNRKTWLIPLGGSCWLGAVGFVNAGLELAAQVEEGLLPAPDRIYMANGTMGSVAGLALGLVLAGLPSRIHAVRVADNRFVRREILERMIRKTAIMLNALDNTIPVSAADAVRIVWRDEFFADAYAAVNEETRAAVTFAADALDLALETTYTGKAMAALLHDIRQRAFGESVLFWNTYNSRPYTAAPASEIDRRHLPVSFKRYYE